MARINQKLLDRYNNQINLIKETAKKENSFDKGERLNRKEEALKDFQTFVNTYFSHRCLDRNGNFCELAPFHIQGVNNIQTDNRYFCFEFPRGHAKSTVFSLFLPIYQVLKGLTKNLLLVSKNKDNATDLLIDIQAEFEENELLINDFGDFKLEGSWMKSKFSIQQGAHFNAIGMGQSPRGTKWNGLRVDTIICDDIDDPELDRSPKRLRMAFNWLKEDLSQTVSIDKPFKIILLGNRFAPDMLLTRFLELGNVSHIKVCAIDENGNPSWSSRFTIEDFERIRTEIGSNSFNREYQHIPVVEGSIFREEWIQYKEEENYKDYEIIVTYFDPSYSKTGDYKSIVTVGYKDREYHILDIFLRKTEMLSSVYYLFKIFNKYESVKANHMLFMESNFAQGEIFKILIEKVEIEMDMNLPIYYDDSQKGNKIARIETLTPYFEMNNIYFNERSRSLSDFKLAVEQLLGFSPEAENDDFPDALHSAISNISSRISLYKTEYTSGNWNNEDRLW